MRRRLAVQRGRRAIEIGRARRRVMMGLLEAAASAPALALLVLTLAFALEIVFARKNDVAAVPGARAPAFAVIVPAHNEAAGIAATLRDINAQLSDRDRLIVVADNCDDDTAALARAGAALVLERRDDERRGKGYAIQYAIDHLRDNDPPPVIIIVDADCRLGEGALSALASTAAQTQRPAQGLYLMTAPANAPPSRRVSEFAWLVMNKVRASGLSRLFDVCRLTGSGMAIPWSLTDKAALASAEIVEDLALGIRFVERGAAPVFCARAVVTSEFPSSERGAARQRARWEHGSARLARRRAGPLLIGSIRRADGRGVAAALDLAIPPLTVLLTVNLGAVGLGLVLLAAGMTAPLALSTAALSVLLAAVFVAWWRFGREVLPLSAAPALAAYFFSKRRVYGADARRSARRWTRTERRGDRASAGDGS